MKIGDLGAENIDGILVITGEAAGAIPNGSRVRKKQEDMSGGGSVPVGGLGTVYSSIATPAEMFETSEIELFPGDEFSYFIIWDAIGNVPVFTRGYKVGAVDD